MLELIAFIIKNTTFQLFISNNKTQKNTYKQY